MIFYDLLYYMALFFNGDIWLAVLPSNFQNSLEKESWSLLILSFLSKFLNVIGPPFSFSHIGVKMKSSKTQTSQFVDVVPAPQSSVSEPHFLFSPSDPAQQQQPGSPLRGYLIPMAIPLGKHA